MASVIALIVSVLSLVIDLLSLVHARKSQKKITAL